MTERRRIVVFIAVLALLALAGVANATIKRHRDANFSMTQSGTSAIELSRGVVSSAWYCAGPIPIRGKGDSGAISIANISSKAASGQLNIAFSSGGSSAVGVSVPPNSQGVVGIPHSKASGFAAATFLSNSSGVGVMEIMQTSSGRSVAPCVSHSTSTAYIGTGSTKAPSDVSLSLFDPGATASVVNVGFLTSTGIVHPPALQGLPLGPGVLGVYDVGQYLPGQAIASAVVTATGGRIVAGAYEVSIAHGAIAASIISGSQPSAKVFFGAAPSGPSAKQVFTVVNPSRARADVVIEVPGTSGLASEAVAMSPASVQVIQLAADRDENAMRWAVVHTAKSSPVIVERTVAIADPITFKPGGRAATPLDPPEVIPAGSTVTSGVTRASKIWLVSGGASLQQTSEVITVANPSSKAVTVTIDQLGVATGSFAARAKLSALTIGPYGMIAVNVGSVILDTNALAFVVTSSGEVVAGAELYAKGSKAPFGFALPSAIPVD